MRGGLPRVQQGGATGGGRDEAWGEKGLGVQGEGHAHTGGRGHAHPAHLPMRWYRLPLLW